MLKFPMEMDDDKYPSLCFSESLLNAEQVITGDKASNDNE